LCKSRYPSRELLITIPRTSVSPPSGKAKAEKHYCCLPARVEEKALSTVPVPETASSTHPEFASPST